MQRLTRSCGGRMARPTVGDRLTDGCPTKRGTRRSARVRLGRRVGRASASHRQWKVEMNKGFGSILIATPVEQHTDTFLLACLVAGMVSPQTERGEPAQELVFVSGNGPDHAVERLLGAARCDTIADVVERLAPGRFRVQEIQTNWDESFLWMIGDEPIERIVLLGCDRPSLAQLGSLVAERAVPVAVARLGGSRLALFLGRRDGGAAGTIQWPENDQTSLDVPHIGMAAVAAGHLACWLNDLDTLVEFDVDRDVGLDLARPAQAPATPLGVGHALATLPARTRLALVSAGGLMSNLALLLATASSEFTGVIRDDDSLTRDQWRYWVFRLMGELAGPKVHQTTSVISAINPMARIEPRALRINRDNVDTVLRQGLFDAVITVPDNDVCRSVVADALSSQIDDVPSPRAHAIGGARHFGAEAYVETGGTASAESVLLLADRASAEQETSGTEPTSCADPRAEAGVVICNLVAAGLLTVELCRILHGEPATGCLLRYSLERNSIRVHGPFARQTRTKTKAQGILT